MLIRRPLDIAPSEITPQAYVNDRRQFLHLAGAALAAGIFPTSLRAEKLPALRPSPYSIIEKATAYEDATSYGNYLEFASDKHSHVERAKAMPLTPWKISIEGLCAKPRLFDFADILKLAAIEERIYRHRCVEGWSMVIPWAGLPLNALIKKVEPLGSAKFIEITSFSDAAIMPNVRRRLLDWPYVEALRLDEAMHPLTLLAVGMYNESLPPQNGGPLRLVVPWKYGFKSAKSIIKIRLTEQQPATIWNRAQPDEYGFYANVNPHVSHPRWSQARERRIGEFFRRDTLMFNGYEPQVGSMYAGMNLQTYF